MKAGCAAFPALFRFDAPISGGKGHHAPDHLVRVPRAYEQLVAWRVAHELAVSATRIVKRMPREDQFTIGNQLRRAAVSVPANLVEGKASFGARSYLRYATIALSSAAETEYLIRLARETDCLDAGAASELESLAWRSQGLIRRLVQGLKVHRKDTKSGKPAH